MTANPAQTPAQKAARRAVKGVGPDTDIAGNPLTDEQKATMREIEARWAREDAMTANPFAALLAGVYVYEDGSVDYEAVLAALAAAVSDDLAEAGKVLEGVTPGPWRVGPVDDCRVEDAKGNEVAQIDGDYNQPETWPLMEANARFIAWCREGVPALIALATAQAAQIEGLQRTYEELYADALADAKSDAQEFDSDLWKMVRAYLDDLHLDWRDFMEDGVTADEAMTHIRECMNEETRRAEAADASLAAMTKERDLLQEAADEAKRLWAESETALAAERAKVAKLVEALTPSGETKAAYIGEFSIPFPTMDADGNEVMLRPNVPWTTLKEIMAAIRARAAITEAGQ